MVAIAATAVALADNVDKLSAGTKVFLQQRAIRELQDTAILKKSPYASPKAVNGVEYINCFINLNDASIGELEALGVIVNGVYKHFVTAKIPVDKIEEVAKLGSVKQVSVSRKMKMFTDQACSVTNADKAWDGTNYGLPEEFTGKDVVLGIIDDGIEFNHTAFKDASGNSRVKAVYRPNQTTASTGGTTVTIDGVTLSGYQYTTTDGISALTTDDTGASHGTHTTGCAAGSKVGNYSGMAPEVDLVLCGAGEGSGLTDDAILNSAKYIANYAKSVGKPCVISISLGSEVGPHDGKSEISLGYDEIAEQYGSVILLAAGNEADRTGYANKTLASSSDAMAVIHTPISSMSNYGLYIYGICDVWNSTSDQLKVQVKVLNSSGTAVYTSEAMSNGTISASTLSSYFTSVSDGGIEIAGSVDAENGRYNLNIVPYLGTNKGSYKLAYVITGSAGNVINVFTENNYSQLASSGSISGYTLSKGQNEGTMCDDMTGSKTISVGAMCSRLSVPYNYGSSTGSYSNSSYSQGDIAYFSSYGTDYNGVDHPFITAPGHSVVSSINRYASPSSSDASYRYSLGTNTYDYWGPMSGTSMATPISAGVVALYLQADPTLDVDGVKEVIRNTATAYSNPASPAKQRGNGIINALAGIEYILNNTTTPKITASPTSLDFGDVAAGTTTTKTFTVTGENLEGNISLTKSGSNYSIDKTSITKNSDGTASATVTVTFSPTANVSQTYTGTVTLASSNASSVTVSLTGKGVYNAPVIAANPTSLSFTGNSGSTYTKTVTVTGSNLQGNITAAIQDDANGFYSVSPTSFNAASTTVTVTWAPTAGGTSTANLVLTTTGTGANTVTVPITGTAQGPTIAANPTSLTFSGYATQTYTQTVTVTGTNLSQNITAAISGANVYSIDKSSLSTSGGSITVTWAPTVAGNTTATLTLSSNGASTVTVPITGTAQAATPTLMVDKTTLAYETQLNESSSQTVTVSGRFLSEDVAVTLTDANNVFSIDKNSLDYTTLNNDGSLTVAVTFNSANEGTFTGTLNLTSGNVSQQVALTGTANDTPTYIYVLTTTLTAGNEYLIVSGNSAGSAYAMGHSNTTVASDAVTIKSDASIADAVYIESDDVDATSVWTAGSSSSLWTFKNGDYYATNSGSGNNRKLTFATSSTNNWTKGDNQLYYQGKNSYYLRYYNNTFSINTSANNIYLYEKTQVVKTPSLSVDPTQLSFTATPGQVLTQTFTVTGTRLNSDVTVTMTNDVGGVFSVDKSNISISEATNGATVTVTFNAPEEMGSYRVGQVTLTSGSAKADVYLFASVGENGTAYGNYLDIQNYSTIGLNDCYAEEFNSPYNYTEYESDECAWLDVPGAMTYIGSAYMGQKWLGRYNANGYWYGHQWDATDVFQGSSYFAIAIDESTTGTLMLGPNVESSALTSNTTQYFGYYNVTNCTQVKALCYNNSGVSSSYATFLAVYELTENADGSLTEGNQVDWQSSTTTNSTVTLTSAELDADKIYRVYVGGYRGFIYEVAFRTPLVTTEATLATIEMEGYPGNRFTISDELVAVYANADEGKLWCKDQGNASIYATEIQDGQIDYMKDRSSESQYWQSKGDWDQSNWVLLQFPEGTETDGIKAMLNAAVGKKIVAGSVTGRYTDDMNYTIEVLPVNNSYTLSTGDDAGYIMNLYCTANFLPSNLNINGGKGALGRYHGDDVYYFFMNPKIQEVCEITYAECEDNNVFVVPDNDSEISGALTVDWSYNAEGTQRPTPGAAYRFVAVVQRTADSDYGHFKSIDREPSTNFVVYPLNLSTADGSDNIITAINGVFADGYREVVGVDYVNTAGMISDKPFQGMNIVVTRYSDGSKTTAKKVFK